MAVRMIPEDREYKGAGCTEGCRWVTVLTPGLFGRGEVVLHDADSHERYGRAQERAEDGLLGWDVATGPLLVRPSICEAYVGGRECGLSPQEWRVLLELARSLGHVVPQARLAARAWGSESWNSAHRLRVCVARLRARLGPAAGLIETKVGFGYRLVRQPYTGPTP